MAFLEAAEFGHGDFILMEDINEKAFLENLQLRFSKNRIYTNIGETVVSVNPYCPLPIYSDEVVEEYRGRAMFERPPHLFSLADSAYQAMWRRSKDSCIVISGESGAGKTEASKIVMRYISKVTSSAHQAEVERVKNLLIQSNPLLEAFGNAKTNRNDNSSRFGKYMDINFDFLGNPVGGHISTYLLEKARVIFQQSGERNFHIFYQILSDASLSKSCGLSGSAKDYAYLKQGDCQAVKGLDDKTQYDQTKQAMKAVGFTSEEQSALFELVSACLLLGELSFTATEKDQGSELNQDEVANKVCQLLKTSYDSLNKALTSRTIAGKQETVEARQTTEKALFARDALAKSLYDSLFTWLVSRVNKSVAATLAPGSKGTVIGVLDIYGFEIFQTNSFEQLCINFCNEKLQQLVIELVLKREQDEYAKEGIPWVNIDYFNNEAICKLIEDPSNGVIAVLDEECLRPGRQDDKSILVHLNKKLSQHKHFASSATRSADSGKLNRETEFQISHYAGKVVYSVVGFIEKNQDTFFQDLKRLLYNTDRQILKDMWPEGAKSEAEVSKRPHSTATGFKLSMATLVETLACKEPYYVRCVKPNASKSPSEFEVELVTHQVRYLGLLENVRVRRAGYSYRQQHNLFLERYKMLSKETWPRWKKDDKLGCSAIVDATKINSEITMGKTKIFIKRPNTIFTLEQKRFEQLPRMATIIQTAWRAWLARKFFRRLRAAVLIKRRYKSFLNRLFFAKVQDTFKDVRLLPDLGKSLVWPKPPTVLQPAVANMQKIHKYWRARALVKRLSPAEQEHVRAKLVSSEHCGGGKMADWGVAAKWPGHALADPSNPDCAKFNAQVAGLRSQYGDSTFLYSANTEKLGRNMKTAGRAILMSDSKLYRLETPDYTVNKKKPPLGLQAISSISLFKSGAPGVVLHLTDSSDGDSVFALCDGRKVAEFLSVMYRTIKSKEGRQLQVKILDELTYMVDGKPRTLAAEKVATGTPIAFKKVSATKAALQWA